MKIKVASRLGWFCRPSGVAVAALVLTYLGGYGVLRHTHAFRVVNKTVDPVAAEHYTLFDTYSKFDDAIYVVFRPACVIDREITGRRFERDKL